MSAAPKNKKAPRGHPSHYMEVATQPHAKGICSMSFHATEEEKNEYKKSAGAFLKKQK